MSFNNNIRLLIISPEAHKIGGWVKDLITAYDIVCFGASDGMSGLNLYNKAQPVFIIIDNMLPDVNGSSLSSIIKGTQQGRNSRIFIVNIDKAIGNLKADYLIFSDGEPYSENTAYMLKTHMQLLIDSFMARRIHSNEIERAIKMQYQKLPNNIQYGKFMVSSLFSPYSDLSGDGLDFWISDNEKGIYGFLFDCTGHDLVSFTATGSIRAIMKKTCMLHQHGVLESMSDIIQEVNSDLFDIDLKPAMTAAIVFYINFKKNVMEFCSAGIPCIYKKCTGQNYYEKIITKNFTLGCFPDVNFDESTIPIENIEEIIVASDGFSELFAKELPKKEFAKHDDVSAIMISLKRKISSEPLLK